MDDKRGYIPSRRKPNNDSIDGSEAFLSCSRGGEDSFGSSSDAMMSPDFLF